MGVQANLGERAAILLVAMAASVFGGNHHDLGCDGAACHLDVGSQAKEARLRLCGGGGGWVRKDKDGH